MKPQAISKALPTLFDAKQEPVREGVKKLAVRPWGYARLALTTAPAIHPHAASISGMIAALPIPWTSFAKHWSIVIVRYLNGLLAGSYNFTETWLLRPFHTDCYRCLTLSLAFCHSAFCSQGSPGNDLQVELRAWLGVDYVQGSLCSKMPDLMRKDVEKLISEYSGSKTQPERFTRREQAARDAAAAAVVPEAGSSQADETGGPRSSRSMEGETSCQVQNGMPCRFEMQKVRWELLCQS